MSRRAGRWVTLALGACGAAWILRYFVASNAEVFWVLFPLFVLAGSHGLKLFAFPRSRSRTRLGRRLTGLVLVSFPTAFYGFLVWATNSIWSWQEYLLSVYFFAVSLELLLLFYFEGIRYSEAWWTVRAKRLWQKVAGVVVLKLVAYSVLVPLLLVVFAVHRPKLIPRPFSTDEAADVESIQFPARDGLLLSGVILGHPKPIGTVIVCHGVGANHSDIKPILLGLLRTGFQVVAFDFRGHGKSYGHTITYGLQERLDILGAYDFCRARADIRETPLFALGCSMGGAALLLALPEMPEIRAAVIDSGYSSLEQMAHHQLRYFPAFVRAPLIQIVRLAGWIEIGADLSHLAPVDRLREISIPLLFVHGTADAVVPPEHARLLHLAAHGPAELLLEPQAPHIGSILLEPVRYLQRVKRHFEANISQQHH